MAHASEPEGSILPAEAAHFGALAADWWDPKGSSAMLHRLNPVRLAYLRDRIDQHWGLDETGLKPLAGKTAADVGCGAGLLAEPLARLGAAVTGIDAAPENIAAARDHGQKQGLTIDYRDGGLGVVIFAVVLGLARLSLEVGANAVCAPRVEGPPLFNIR